MYNDWDQVRDQVWDQVRDQVGAQVWAQVGTQVWNQVWDQVGNQVGTQVYDQVRDQVWDQVRDQVKNKKLEFIEQGLGLQYSAWIAFYEFFRLLNKIKIESQDYKRYADFNKKGIYSIQYFKSIVFICKLPIKVLRDDNNNLHSLLDGAVQWRDGQKNYFIHGVSFDYELWSKITSHTITAKEILSLNNQEQKSIAIKEIGFDTIIKELGSNVKVLDISKKKIFIDGKWREQENELYEISGIFPFTMKTIKCICPSTGRNYFLDVPPETTNANEGISWSFNITKNEYEAMTIET